MTRDEILAMPAGREMDELIAIKVIGWTDMGIEWKPRYQKPSKIPDGVQVLYELPHYSTDIGAAWEVVQALYNKKLEKEYLQGLYAQGIIDLHLIAHHTPDVDCRAALLAVMEG